MAHLLLFMLLMQTPEQKEFFETRIRPVLAQQCFICHTNSRMGGLRLDSLDDLMKGGEHGPAIVPGDPEKSLLIASVRHLRRGSPGVLA